MIKSIAAKTYYCPTREASFPMLEVTTSKPDDLIKLLEDAPEGNLIREIESKEVLQLISFVLCFRNPTFERWEEDSVWINLE